MRLLKVLAAVAVSAGSLLVVDSQASALTPYRTFAYTRDQYQPYVALAGGAMANPEMVRVLINDGSYQGLTRLVRGRILCRQVFGPDWIRELTPHNFGAPKTIVWNVPGASTHCWVYVEAYHLAPSGVLSLTAQAAY